MSKTLFFYDLETSGFNPSEQRIMQFAGQRTDLKLNLIGEPHNYLIKLTEDILPDPFAIILTGITPQKTISEGLSEAEFLKIFENEISTPDTVFVGFNSVRFDDEFMRYLHYRNFYDPYEWQWQKGRSKWDLLDVVRMTRALRPEGINWPIKDDKPNNQLENLTKANKIKHTEAHDALGDVVALISLAQLLNSKQPKLFSFLLSIMSDRKQIAKLVDDPNPFVYTSGKYPSEFEKTTVVAKLVDHPNRAAALVFDLRHNPEDYVDLSVDELVEAWLSYGDERPKLPIKTMQFNRCPAIAPLGVLDSESQKRINFNLETIQKNYKTLIKVREKLSQKILQALAKLDKDQAIKFKKPKEVDAMLYDSFFSDPDRMKLHVVRQASVGDDAELKNLHVEFDDSRLNLLLPLYKARNFRSSLSSEEVEEWEKFRKRKLLGGNENSHLARFFKELENISSQKKMTSNQSYLIEELKLYAESIIPLEDL